MASVHQKQPEPKVATSVLPDEGVFSLTVNTGIFLSAEGGEDCLSARVCLLDCAAHDVEPKAKNAVLIPITNNDFIKTCNNVEKNEAKRDMDWTKNEKRWIIAPVKKKPVEAFFVQSVSCNAHHCVIPSVLRKNAYSKARSLSAS